MKFLSACARTHDRTAVQLLRTRIYRFFFFFILIVSLSGLTEQNNNITHLFNHTRARARGQQYAAPIGKFTLNVLRFCNAKYRTTVRSCVKLRVHVKKKKKKQQHCALILNAYKCIFIVRTHLPVGTRFVLRFGFRERLNLYNTKTIASRPCFVHEQRSRVVHAEKTILLFC
jgi:hypothetical protein